MGDVPLRMADAEIDLGSRNQIGFNWAWMSITGISVTLPKSSNASTCSWVRALRG